MFPMGVPLFAWLNQHLNQNIFLQYLNNEVNQHSVGMYYVDLELCVNDPEYKSEYSSWNKYIGLLGNATKAYDNGYFWAIKEAKLIEVSAVLQGSNELTPTIDNNYEEKPRVITNEKSVDNSNEIGRAHV